VVGAEDFRNFREYGQSFGGKFINPIFEKILKLVALDPSIYMSSSLGLEYPEHTHEFVS
jgi:hypothetical protein